MKRTTRLRELLQQPGMLIAPGAHDVMTARIVEAEGFPVDLGLPRLRVWVSPIIFNHRD